MGLLDAVGVNTSQSDLAGWDVQTQTYSTLGGCASAALVASTGASGSHGPSRWDEPVAVVAAGSTTRTVDEEGEPSSEQTDLECKVSKYSVKQSCQGWRKRNLEKSHCRMR